MTSNSRLEFSLACECGNRVTLGSDQLLCSCGRNLGSRRENVFVVTDATKYWGEIPHDQMLRLMEMSMEKGWRTAIGELREDMQENIASPHRAAFENVFPLAPGSRILDVGAGMGGIATSLAAKHHVVALEGVWERARFIAIRKEQDQLDNLTVINGDLNRMVLAPNQFDAIIVNGVLEWAGLFDLSLPPDQVQVRFMAMLRRLLAPRGFIYVGIENRFGWDQLRGMNDHSGLPYTSVMPRWMARWVCSREAKYRSTSNTGYRTYTYSYRGYSKLFAQAGLKIDSLWISPNGYSMPTAMVPLNKAAIQLYASNRWAHRSSSGKGRIKRLAGTLSARPWFWRWFGTDFMFLLRGAEE